MGYTCPELLCAQPWRQSHEQIRPGPCPRGASLLLGETGVNGK